MIGTQPRFVYNAGGNPIGVYRLKSLALATSLLERHLAQPVPEQFEQVEML